MTGRKSCASAPAGEDVIGPMPTTAALTPASATLDWGRTHYAEALARQEELVARRNAGEIGDTLVFTEHEPVYTLGVRRGAAQNLLWTADMLRARGIEVHPTTRGGDITYHGPGQVVGYPIVNLAPRKDLHAYLRFLEDVMIAAVARYGLTAGRNPGKTGIWIERRKIAAIGVAVKKWTTYHGFALNVNTDLAHFAGIVPCGITAADGTVTSLQAELGREVDLAQVRAALAAEFWRQLPGFLNHG
jgi:lipoyl(octanoyl) transferase